MPSMAQKIENDAFRLRLLVIGSWLRDTAGNGEVALGCGNPPLHADGSPLLVAPGILRTNGVEIVHEPREAVALAASGVFIALDDGVPQSQQAPGDFAGGFIADQPPGFIANVLPAQGSAAEFLPPLLDDLEANLCADTDFGQIQFFDSSDHSKYRFAKGSAGVDVQIQNDKIELGLLEKNQGIESFPRVAKDAVEFSHDDGIAGFNATHHVHELRTVLQTSPAGNIAVSIESAPFRVGGEFPVFDPSPVFSLSNPGLRFKGDVLFISRDSAESEGGSHGTFSKGGGVCR
jgi:hypothetical protein